MKMKKAWKMSAQAAGGAVAHNDITAIVSDHLVVGQNGKLTGYTVGIEKYFS